jgi:hypothetical protein
MTMFQVSHQYAHEFLEKYDQRKIALTFNYKIENQVRIGLNPWPFRALARVELVQGMTRLPESCYSFFFFKDGRRPQGF